MQLNMINFTKTMFYLNQQLDKLVEAKHIIEFSIYSADEVTLRQNDKTGTQYEVEHYLNVGIKWSGEDKMRYYKFASEFNTISLFTGGLWNKVNKRD